VSVRSSSLCEKRVLINVFASVRNVLLEDERVAGVGALEVRESLCEHTVLINVSYSCTTCTSR
jgi:hypothetical protein